MDTTTDSRKTILVDPTVVSVSKQGDKQHVWLVIVSVVRKETAKGTIIGGTSGDAGMVKCIPNADNPYAVGDTLEGSYELGEHFPDEEVARFRTVKPI